ncbi:MAG: hypothetical protein GY941_13140 [Planctomycetes bacterium]|nr:hypothetical protein [Planctomycetota bacterium]
MNISELEYWFKEYIETIGNTPKRIRVNIQEIDGHTVTKNVNLDRYIDDGNKCELCGMPMPKDEQNFKYHGYSGPCPKPTIEE